MSLSADSLREILAGRPGLGGTLGIVRGVPPAWGLSGHPSDQSGQMWGAVDIAHEPEASFPIGFGAPPPPMPHPHPHPGGGGHGATVVVQPSYPSGWSPSAVVVDASPGFLAFAPTVDAQGRASCPPGYRLACVPLATPVSAGLGAPGPFSPPETVASLQELVRQTKALALAGDLASAQAAYQEASDLLGQMPDRSAYEADVAFARSVAYDEPGALAQASHDAGSLGAAVAAQPGLLDRLAVAPWDAPLAAFSPLLGLSYPNATVRDAVTAAGGFSSSLGVTTPQSGADLRAKQQADAALSSGQKLLLVALGLAAAGAGAYGLSRVLR